MNDALRVAMAERGLTVEALAEKVGVDPKTVGRWVSPGRLPQPRHRLAVAVVLDREIGDLWPESVKRRDTGWFRPWEEIEQEAHSLRSFEPSVLPGLLQTEAYARAVLACGPVTGEDLDTHVAARMARKAAVLDRPRPPMTVFVIDEAALLRGDPEIMHPQLDHLVELAGRQSVMVHVVPLRAGLHPGQAGAFVIASVEHMADVGYIDDQAEGRISEDVAPLWRTWDTVRSVALPRDQSIEYIERRAWMS